jgi:lysophospholipase L1-like esterase
VDYETKRQDYRALVVPGLGGDSCGADAVVDIAANTTIGDSGDQNNTTYYNADTVHLKTAGYAIVAQAVADVINTWI